MKPSLTAMISASWDVMLALLDDGNGDTLTAQHGDGKHGGLDEVKHGMILGNEEATT